jgi:hypothetical protein
MKTHTPRELTEEEIKTVSGGNSPKNAPWSNAGGLPFNGADNNWRDNNDNHSSKP